MENSNYTIIGLYPHNITSYNLIKESFDAGKNVVGIVHATGTGKSYNALQLAYDNKHKKIIYVVPTHAIMEHIIKIIEDNSNLNVKRDFPNLVFKTYQSFISLSEDEIANMDCDLLILDEFHHIGAPIWGERINCMLSTHPDMKIFGMTAYTVRDRKTSFERDMTNPETNELFSNNIASRYDLCDAMIDGVLPKPIYKSAHINLFEMEKRLEEKVKMLGEASKEYNEYMKILHSVKARIHDAPSISCLLKKSMKPNGKYIYFCPQCSSEGINDIETIKKQALDWFKEFVSEDNIIIYTSTNEMGEEGKLNRKAFYDDVSLNGEKVDNKLRVMFAINQYNEGVHAPNIDGVIMGRGTSSDIVYFEQLGRALSVRGNTKDTFDKLEKYSIDELINICKEKDIFINKNASKEELIEKLIAPVVIDLTNNYEYIKELENNLKNRIKEVQNSKNKSNRIIKIHDVSFDIEIENQDLYETLRYVMDRLTMTWADKYNLAKAYYEHYGNLEIPGIFKTLNGYEYDENGISLGQWISYQRMAYNGKGSFNISQERVDLLKKIGMRFDTTSYNEIWNDKYNLAKTYYEHHGNLKIPLRFKTINGYEYDEDGIKLGNWIGTQRNFYKNNKLSKDKIDKLLEIGMIFYNQPSYLQGDKMYLLAQAYYKNYGNLEIPDNFKTKNGYDYDKDGYKLGSWISDQREKYKNGRLSNDRYIKLSEIGMRFTSSYRDIVWNNKYELAKKYFEYYGNLRVNFHFETENGIDYCKGGITLGRFISDQRVAYKKNIISQDRINKLNQIGMIWNALDVFDNQVNEIITQKNLNKNISILQDILYQLLNEYDNNLLPANDELNNRFIDELDSKKVLKK